MKFVIKCHDNLRQFMTFSVPSPSSRPLLDFAGFQVQAQATFSVPMQANVVQVHGYFFNRVGFVRRLRFVHGPVQAVPAFGWDGSVGEGILYLCVCAVLREDDVLVLVLVPENCSMPS